MSKDSAPTAIVSDNAAALKDILPGGKSVKKGTRCYYKMRSVREIAGETVYNKWSNIVMKTGR